jgi:uncharacterized protein with NAD-binding domain and iron-sulfur cluster
MREKVAIVGGGIAGLSTAHELMERGFEVHVFERRRYLGGKAASYRVAKPSVPAISASARTLKAPQAELDDPPGEHGFRFFPGWYRHLTDTMARIPYHSSGGGRRSVADNLVSVKSNLLAWFDRAPISLPLRVPGSVNEAVDVSNFFSDFSSLGITTGELALFVRKMVEFLACSEEKRVELFERITWWDYLECAKPGRSRAYQDFVRATTRTMVAAKAEQVSAYTIGRIVIRTLLDTLSSLDRVLNGPTSEAWLEPWVAHLEARGVRFRTDTELKSIDFDSRSRKVRRLTFESIPLSHSRRLRRRITESLRADFDGVNEKDLTEVFDALAQSTDDEQWLEAARDATETAIKACQEWAERGTVRRELEKLRAKKPRGAGVNADESMLETRLDTVNKAFERTKQDLIGNHELKLADIEMKYLATPAGQPVEAAYYVLALPLEQLVYYVNRSSMLTFLAPELRNLLPLSRNLDWMAGIQFYFARPLDIAPGHIVGLDSDWALTAIEQTQFWQDVNLRSDIRGVLSVDIAAWNKKGRSVRKEAYNCDADEIAREVWAQLSEMLNKPNRFEVLREDMLVGGSLKKGVSYHLDETIVERYDRKKQAAYERARGLEFSTLTDHAAEAASEEKSVDSFMWGQRRLFNPEALLINRVGTRKLRPEAATGIANLFLAADYVKTDTDLACMEGANEAARRAVNGILEAASSREPRCELWPFSPSRQAMEAVMAIAAPMQAVRSVTNVVARWQDRFFKNIVGGQ